MDLGEGLGIPYDSDIFSRARALRLSVDPHDANSISFVYKYRSSAWNLLHVILVYASGRWETDLRDEGHILDDYDPANVSGRGGLCFALGIRGLGEQRVQV